MLPKFRFGAGVALATTLLSIQPASAQATGFGVSRFEPSERGSEWFALESLDLRGHLRPAVGIVAEYQHRPLAIYNVDGSLRTALVSDLVVLHPGASLVLWERLRVGVSVPVQIYANGDSGPFAGTVYPAPKSDQAIGDVRLGTDVRLFGTHGDAITGAIGLQVGLPTGDRDSYAGDGAIRLAPRALVAGDIGMFSYAARAGIEYRYLSQAFATSFVGTQFLFGASAGVRAIDKKLLVGPEIFGATTTDGDQVFGRRTTPLEGLLGAHYTAGSVRFGGGVGAGLTRGFGTPVAHVLANLEWIPAVETASDRDRDGVLDADDACPDVAGVKTNDPKTNGCPRADRDRDGIFDTDDACPDEPGIKTADASTNGCADRDNDGIVDKLDACVDVPGVASSDPKENGCPSDRDHDGVLDAVDACPDTPGLKTDDPKTNGCPDPDRDKDGIPNDVDACPDDPGASSPDPKRNGCPKAFVQAGEIKILDQVKFKTNSAEILPGKDSVEVLEAVLKVMTDHPEIKAVRIEGHTDARGNANLNRTLSARRAASVKAWLVAHGIDASRLSSSGSGPDKPIDSNDTDAGRQANRRVEFHIGEENK